MNGKPIRSPHACSIAAKPLLHRAGVPTTSGGRVPMSAALSRRISPPDAIGSTTTHSTEDGKKNDKDKLGTLKSGESKNQSSPHVVTARPHRQLDEVFPPMDRLDTTAGSLTKFHVALAKWFRLPPRRSSLMLFCSLRSALNPRHPKGSTVPNFMPVAL